MRSDRQLFKYMLSLIEKLKQVKDFRKDQGKRHPLWIVLVVIILKPNEDAMAILEKISEFLAQKGMNVSEKKTCADLSCVLPVL